MRAILVVGLVVLAQCVFAEAMFLDADVVCPNNGQALYEHTSSCSKFYECNNGVLAEEKCAEGLHFNQNVGFCDVPSNVGCMIEEGGKEEAGGEGDSLDICPGAGQHFYPHPSSCSKFYECNGGLLAEVDCIPGLHFNPQIGFCDFPTNVNCELDSSEEGDPEEPGPVGECPALNGDYVTFLTHSSDCTKFFMCNWGVAIAQDCPSGLHFNPILNVCDWPRDAGCNVA